MPVTLAGAVDVQNLRC